VAETLMTQVVPLQIVDPTGLVEIEGSGTTVTWATDEVTVPQSQVTIQ